MFCVCTPMSEGKNAAATPAAAGGEPFGKPFGKPFGEPFGKPFGKPFGEPFVVGIGASAGGLAALKAFFSTMAADSGLAFVVVVHLAPEFESQMAELLQPHTQMPVQQVEQMTALAANHVYVIPPGRNLSSIDTHLRLSDLEENRRARAPIDHFFRTLAGTHEARSIGVVLTGTGSDGALGLKAIKERGGLTVAQDPNDAEFNGMPQSAVATVLVDLILPLAEIPAHLLRFVRTEPRRLVAEEAEEAEPDDAQAPQLQKLFAQIRARTGRDFSGYKRSTLLRRIRRRMQLLHIDDLPDYVSALREQPDEARALADDILITVTNFFRDAEVFEQISSRIIPGLFQGKGPDDALRVWSVGCATGEEAYSLAMLLLEEAARRPAPPMLQVFASDLHQPSLYKARDGFYAGEISRWRGLRGWTPTYRRERFSSRVLPAPPMPASTSCRRSWRSPNVSCATFPRISKPAARRCAPPTKSCSRPTRSCTPLWRNSRRRRKSSSR